MAPVVSTPTLVPRIDLSDMVRLRLNAAALLNVWIYFNLIANTILLPILVLTFVFSKKAKRHPVLVNLCITWILSGIFSLLLYYADQYDFDTPEPSKPLCIAQTTLLYGITPMWSVAVFALIYHMISIVSGAEISRRKLLVMLASPYIVQCIFSIAALALSVQHPDKVTRNRRFFYCALKYDALSDTVSAFTGIVCLGILVLEIKFAIVLYRRWRGLKRVGRSSHLDIQIFIRVLVFGIYILFGVVADVILVFDSQSLAPDIYAATIGAVLVLVFGSQPDVLRAWCFWRKDEPQPVLHYASLNSNRMSEYARFDLLKSPVNVPSPPPTTPKRRDVLRAWCFWRKDKPRPVLHYASMDGSQMLEYAKLDLLKSPSVDIAKPLPTIPKWWHRRVLDIG